MRRTFPVILAACLFALTACGHTTRSTCPGHHDFMGCAAGVNAHPPTKLRYGAPKGVAYPGPKFPDVSSYQGHPNWVAIKPAIEGAIAKAGEYTEDPTFAYNVAALKALHLPVGAYWFVRNTGCAHEGAQIVSVIRSVGGVTGPVVLDMEVPEARGYAYCLAHEIHAGLGVWPAIYTAPGTWPGGSTYGLKLWLAAYGPSSPPTLNGLRPVAWQAWSPPYTYYYLPGLGYGDVSVDLNGFLAQAKPQPKPDPYAFLPNTPRHFGNVTARERSTIRQWDRAHCREPARRPVCVSTHRHMLLLAGRISHVAHYTPNGHRYRHPKWQRNHLGQRYQAFLRRLAGAQ